jgi:hypothetical protein
MRHKATMQMGSCPSVTDRIVTDRIGNASISSDLPPGAIYLRLVVHDLENSKVGSTEVPLLVAKS